MIDLKKAEAAARFHLGCNRELFGKNPPNYRLQAMRSSLSPEMPSVLAEGVIAWAEQGDKTADEALRAAAADALETGRLINQKAAQYAANRLRNPTNKTARWGEKDKNRLRDMAIAVAVFAAADEGGIFPTRSEARKGQESACAIVSRVLKDFGLHLSEDGVEKIWKHCKDDSCKGVGR